MIYDKDIEQINGPDLQELIDKEITERKKIEYKSVFDTDKREFLADVSSFANASGGIIIYGMSEKAGVPIAKNGIAVSDVDQEILRLESIIRDGIEPRIPSERCWPIKLPNSNYVIVVKVQKSWISPHRVKSNDKFYSRSSNGKYPLDVGELRVAFNLSETLVERIRGFRQERIEKIFSRETPVPFYDGAKILLHLIPFISFGAAQSYDIQKVASNSSMMPPISSVGWSSRYNLDGYLNYSQDQEKKTFSYVQLFRNGIIEALEGGLLQPSGRGLLIPSVAYEQELIKSLNAYIPLLRSLGVEPPIVVFLHLLKVKGFSMALKERFWERNSFPIERDNLLLPEVLVESYGFKAEKILKPCFDAVWNACGFARSFNYNEAGEWAPPH